MDADEVIEVEDESSATEAEDEISTTFVLNRPKIITSQDPTVILFTKNVLEKCKKEYEENKLAIPINQFVDRTSYYTGLQKETLYKMYPEIKEPNVEIFNFTEFDKLAIRTILSKIYENKETCTFEELRKFLMEKTDNVPELTQFTKTMKLLGYDYVPTPRGTLLMEKLTYTYSRTLLLKKIQDGRQKYKQIYYFSVKSLNDDTANVRDMLFYHVISKDGYEKGFFCVDETMSGHFKWLTHILIPSLKPCSLIVVVDDPKLGQVKPKPITRYHTKSDMLQWLNVNNIPCNATMCKAQLFDLIERTRTGVENTSLENIFRAYNHEVVCLPEHFKGLSSTELFWKDVNINAEIQHTNKNQLNSRIAHEKMLARKDKIQENLLKISKEQFLEYENRIIDLHSTVLAVEKAIEDSLDKYKIDADAAECIHERKCHIKNDFVVID